MAANKLFSSSLSVGKKYIGTIRPRWNYVIKCRTMSSGGAGSTSETRKESAQATKLTDIGIRDIFNSEHDIFRQSARRFFQQEAVPFHSEWEKNGEVSREIWKKAGAHGILGITCPAECGGPGGDWLSTVVAIEEQMYSNCTGPGFFVHSEIIMPYIYKYGSKEQIERYVPGMIDGSIIASIGMTEPGAGSDLQGIRTSAKRDGDDWILNGSKIFITNGWLSDVVIVVAVTDTGAKSAAHGISLFIVDTGTPGYKKGRKLQKIGLKASDTAELFFDDVRIPNSALLGKLNHGFYYMMKELPQERILTANLSLSAAEFIFEETREYVRQRKAFGKTLSALQTVQHKMADLKTEICVTRAFIDRCNKIHNDVKLDTQMASMSKYWATDLQNRVATSCLQLHGGMGFMWETPVARAFCDARCMPILAGSNEIMKELIVRSIFTDK